MKMTKEELAAKLEAHAKWLKTRWTDHVEGKRANLSDADLHDADLRDADLRDADLSYADLSGADLHGADLSDADLHGADLSGADLHGANLHDANLSDADLRVYCASPYVYDALAASFAAQMALKKTRIEWEAHRNEAAK